MSSSTPTRRVRHDVRDNVTLMLFSAATSCGLVAVLAVLVRLGN